MVAIARQVRSPRPATTKSAIRANTAEKLDRWQEGALILFGLRGIAFVLLIGCLVWLVHPAGLAWAEIPLPTCVRWSGVSLAGLAFLMYPWTFHHLGRNLTDTVVTREAHFLVTTGPRPRSP